MLALVKRKLRKCQYRIGPTNSSPFAAAHTSYLQDSMHHIQKPAENFAISCKERRVSAAVSRVSIPPEGNSTRDLT